MGAAALFAIKHAVEAARADIGQDTYFPLGNFIGKVISWPEQIFGFFIVTVIHWLKQLFGFRYLQKKIFYFCDLFNIKLKN